MSLERSCSYSVSSSSKTRDGNFPISTGSSSSARSKCLCRKKRRHPAMSRDAFFDDLRSGLHKEPRSSNGRTDSRPTEPSRDVEESPANRQIDTARPQVTQRKPEALDTPRAHYLGDSDCLLRTYLPETLVD